MDSSKTEIISLPPDSEFTSTNKLHENEWNSSEIISRKTKEDVFDVYGRGPRGRDIQQGLDPSQTALCQGAKEKKGVLRIPEGSHKSKVGLPRIQNRKGVQRYKAPHVLFSTPSRTLCDRAASERERTRPTPSPKDHTKGQTYKYKAKQCGCTALALTRAT